MKRRTFARLLILLLCLFAFPVFSQAEISSLQQLNAPGMKVGVSQGSAAENTVRAELPKAEIVYFTDNHGLRLERMGRKRWDKKHAEWRYIGFSIATGRYFINRETIDEENPNEIICSYLVELNTFGERHIEAQGLKNAYYIVTRVDFVNRSGNLFARYLGGSICDVKGNVIAETPPVDPELTAKDSMDWVVYEAAVKKSFD